MYLLPIHIEIDLLYQTWIEERCCEPLRTVWLATIVFAYRVPELGFLKKRSQMQILGLDRLPRQAYNPAPLSQLRNVN